MGNEFRQLGEDEWIVYQMYQDCEGLGEAPTFATLAAKLPDMPAGNLWATRDRLLNWGLIDADGTHESLGRDEIEAAKESTLERFVLPRLSLGGSIFPKFRNSVEFALPRGDIIAILEGVRDDASPAEACREIIRIYKQAIPTHKGA